MTTISGPQTFIAGGDVAGRTCPYCRFPIKEGGEVVGCGACHAPHHVDCWADNHGCAVIACAGGPPKGEGSYAATERMPVSPEAQTVKQPAAPPGPPVLTPQVPQPAPPQVQQDGGNRRGPTMPVAIVLLALAIGGVGAALALTSRSSSPSQTITEVTHHGTQKRSAPVHKTQAHLAAQSHNSNPAASLPNTPPPTAPPTASTGVSSPTASGPVGALRSYWTLIKDGQYKAAYKMQSPGLQSANTSWVSDHYTARPIVNIVSVGPASGSSGTVNVGIDLWTRDRHPSRESDTDCRNWNGDATMVQNSDGSWSLEAFPIQPTVYSSYSSIPNCF